jgi:predicted 3-demethylubiquinone-9 3-methyltransferase (glyoxalase superfamily)
VVKKGLSVLIAFTLVFSLSAVESEGVEIAPYIVFSSLEDFLNAYLAAKEGGDIKRFLKSEYAYKIFDITGIKVLYFLTEITENYTINEIVPNLRVGNVSTNASIKYSSEDADIAIETSEGKTVNITGFQLFVSSHNNEEELEDYWNEIQRINEVRSFGMIDGKYDISYVPANASAIYLSWKSDLNYFSLKFSFQRQETGEFATLSYEDIVGLVRFTEIRAVEIAALLSEMFTTSDALLILRAVAGLLELTDEQAERFGIDSEPTTADALRILRIVAGL